MKLSNYINIPESATLTVNPCTAYRLIKDFTSLCANDTVIQNGANSAVGQAVHQLCSAWGIRSVGVIRDRPDADKLKETLKAMGATEVFTEEELKDTKIFETELKQPKLALNCIGGKSVNGILKHLNQNGILVTYGGMSREPVSASTASFIFKNISIKGFWITQWTRDNYKSKERKNMLEQLCFLIEQGKLKAPIHEFIALSNYKEAIEATLNPKGFTGKKLIFRMNDKC